MAVKKWYWKNATASGSSHGSLSEVAPTANTGALATGWTVDTVASGYSLMIWGTRRASSTFAAPAQPASAPTTNDCVRTTDGTGTGKYTGAFVAGVWTLASTLSSAIMSGSNVKLEFRLWRSVNADGSSATEITSGAVETNAFVGVDSGANLVSGTFSPGVVTLTGEYLFLQVACRINALGSGGATEDANISIFQMVGATPGVAAITSPEFTASGSEMIPKFQAAGAAVSNTIAVSPAWPSHVTGDIALLFVESANEAITLSTPAGFVEVTNSPQGTGVAAATTATRLAVFWCRATSGAMGAPTVTDPGDHVIAQILTFRGCTPSGNPFNISAGDTAAASTTVTVPGATSTAYACLVVLAAANPVDSASDQSIKNWVNANLANITEVASSNTISGNGGGFSVATGEFYTPGAYGSTTCTRLTSTVQGRMSIALMPPVLTDEYMRPSVELDAAPLIPLMPWRFATDEWFVSGGSTAYTASLSETISIAESVASLLRCHPALSESISLTEAVAVIFRAHVALSESRALSEAIAATFRAHPSLSESESLSESLTSKFAAHAALAESRSITETLTSKFSAHAAVSEAVALSEAVAATFRAHASVVESVSVAESAAVRLAAHAALAESVGLVELVAAALAASAGLSEAVGLSESLAAVLRAVAGLSEALTVGESASAGGAQHFDEGLSETVSIGESLAAVLRTSAQLVETVSIAESAATDEIGQCLLMLTRATQAFLQLGRGARASLILERRTRPEVVLGRDAQARLVFVKRTTATLNLEKLS
jgi:hypothetical protein